MAAGTQSPLPAQPAGFLLPRAVSLGCGLTLDLPQGLSRGGLSLFSGFAWWGGVDGLGLVPQVRRGANPSTSVLALSCARSSQPPESIRSVQGFGSSSSPLEVTGICFPAKHTCGDHWNLCRCLGANPPLWRSQGSVFASQTSLLEATGISFSRGHRALCFPAKPSPLCSHKAQMLVLVPPKLPWWRRC